MPRSQPTSKRTRVGHSPSQSIAKMTETERAKFRLLRAVGGKFGYLPGTLIALLMSAPLIVQGWVWNLLLGLFASAVLVASLHAARPERRS